MTDQKTAPSKFWADASRKVGSAFGWAALVVPTIELVEPVVNAWGTESHSVWHHLVAVAVVGALRAVVALVQGNVGDPDKASFQKAGS